VDPTSLRIEVPEGFFSRTQSEIQSALGPLRDLGVRIGIDDFGSGCVSVGQLHRYPVDFLKMDRQFVADLPRKDGGNGRAVRAILAMAGSLGLDVIAPGVETSLQEEILRQMACPKAQGYLFSAPVDAEKAGRLLETGRLGPRH
jgi:EAL domain-containing protein (putative c-di-GMP-specific phosphodiesterase class I)